MQESVQSVDRALCILEALSDYEDGLGITEIGQKVSLHKSTVYRLVNTLVNRGYINQDCSTNKYRLTLKLFELGSKKVEKMDLVAVAKPYLKELMEKTGEVVHLVVREGIQIIYVSKVEPPKSIMMYTRIGMSKPMYCTAMGKAMMAELSEKEVEDIWEKSDVKKYTDNTIVDLDSLKENLKKVKLNGFALDNQEVETGIVCEGAAIKNYKGETCASISVSSSIIGFNENKSLHISKCLLEYANKISRELGYKKSAANINIK
ncbi:MAG: IclR family transcriptional regulator [Clostridium sp.]|nr:IclR family transcriptional regulator [Clostridium sp.]